MDVAACARAADRSSIGIVPVPQRSSASQESNCPVVHRHTDDHGSDRTAWAACYKDKGDADVRVAESDLVPEPLRLTTSLIETPVGEPNPRGLEAAAEAIRDGEVVAIPSDALYVLVADPFNLNAVAKVFEAKRREASRSLPLLVDSLPMAEKYAVRLPSSFYLLARRFWPGPLAVIVKASSNVPLRVTGNTGRLALRRSASPLASRLVETLGTPLIATSANVSGRPTCRSGFEVLGTMDGRIRLILDGGVIDGAAATTVDITPVHWRLIKEGAVPRGEIDACLAT